MKKKLLAVAVAGALAVPGVALAQSSVTISGIFKTSFENVDYSGRAAAAVGRSKENRLSDDSSRIIFNVVEDLGGGLQAIGQADVRINMEAGTIGATGNTHVGLRSKTLGRVFIGRQDLHYFNRESNLTDLAGSLRADSISLIAFAGGGGVAIAGATRTPNVIHYTSPSWGGFTVVAAYSSNAAGNSADVGSVIRAGNAWNINPNYAAQNWQVGYSHWNSKPDGGGVTVATGDQRSDRLYGSFKIAGFKVGLAWDKSKIKSAGGVASGTELSNRTAWSIPVSYVMGNNQFHAHYTKARDDRALAGDNAAKMFAMSYQYTLSKRTSVGVTYAKITNSAAAAYNFFTGGAGSLSNSTYAIGAGEDPRLLAGTIRHAF